MVLYKVLECLECHKLYQFNWTKPGRKCINEAKCSGMIYEYLYNSREYEHKRHRIPRGVNFPEFFTYENMRTDPEFVYTFKDLWHAWPTFICMVDEKRVSPKTFTAPSIYDILKTKEKEFSDHVDFYKAPLAIFDRQRIETAQQCIKETKELFNSFTDDCLEKKFIADNSEDLSFTLRKMHLLSLINDNVTDDDSLKIFSDFQQGFVGDKVAVEATSEDGFEQIENQTNSA